LQIKSCDNLADLFTKSLPTSVLKICAWDWYATTSKFARIRGRHLLDATCISIILYSFLSQVLLTRFLVKVCNGVILT
jgi:hypothetical protein